MGSGNQTHISSSSPRPSYPHSALSSSAASSPSFSRNSGSFDSISTLVTQGNSMGMSPGSAAPLPSPNSQASSYFSPLSPAGTTANMNPSCFQGQQQSPDQQAQRHAHELQQQQQQQRIATAYIGQRGQDGGLPSTAPYLQDFSLLAEAAKRAQMACLARDLGDCGL